MAMQERYCLGCGITGKKATIIHPLEDFQKAKSNGLGHIMVWLVWST